MASGSFAAPDHEYPSHLELRLTATDSGGASTTVSRRLDPQTVVLTFQSSPSGLQLAVGSTQQTTSFTRTAIVGSSVSVSAPSPQGLSGQSYTFSSWSDGGAQTHNVVASTAATYTATYAEAATPGPVISNVRATGVNRDRATISWTTNVPADSQVEYWITPTAKRTTTLDRQLVTSHSQALTGLIRKTRYTYHVLSRNSGGILSVSPDFTFDTK